MQVVKSELSASIPTTETSETNMEEHLLLARTQCAEFPTRLALARWTRGGDVPHLYGSANLPARATWLTQTQQDFACWLKNGGFAQHYPNLSAETR